MVWNVVEDSTVCALWLPFPPKRPVSMILPNTDCPPPALADSDFIRVIGGSSGSGQRVERNLCPSDDFCRYFARVEIQVGLVGLPCSRGSRGAAEVLEEMRWPLNPDHNKSWGGGLGIEVGR
jgi:hypothetical protein